MKTFRDLLYKHRDRLVEISKHEAGAATGPAYRAQIDGALSGADGLISEFQRMKWQEDRGVKNETGYDNQPYVLREAAGDVRAITPSHVRPYITVGQVVPALLACCTVVLIPAPDTPAQDPNLDEPS